MELKVIISSQGNSFELTNAVEFGLVRSMGEAVKWYYTLDFTPEMGNVDKLLYPIMQTISSGLTEIQGFIEGEEISPRVQVTGITPGSEYSGHKFLNIEGTYTKPKRNVKQFDPVTDPFVPRKRVLHAKNLYKLIEQFNHIVKVPDYIQHDLDEISFPDEGRSVFIQDGVSDWEFLSGLLCRFSSLNQWENPLILSGSATDENPFWTIVWGAEQSYLEKEEIESRLIEMDIVGDGQVSFSFATLRYGSLGPDASLSNTPIVQHVYPQRQFDLKKWKEWRVKDVPVFLEDGNQKKMIYKIVDRIGKSGKPDSVNWKSELSILPAPGKFLPRRISKVLQPWIGIGEVIKNAPKSPWLEVKLVAFQDNDKKDNHINVRLTTPYSGNGGRNGLHLLPEKNTMVVLAWSGAWDESVVLCGNVRVADMELEHPSFKLEKPTTWQMDELNWLLQGTTINSGDLNWNAGDVNWQSKNAKWNANDYSVIANGNHTVDAGADSSINATGNTNVGGRAVNVEAETSIAINGKTDVKINC